MNYYNDNDPKVCAWLRELIKAKLIPDGDVDERSITEVRGDDLVRYNGVHFFAGIGGWALAFRLAGIKDDADIWTGSCPCQPFSQSGKRKVDKDKRHLWPDFRERIAERKPAILFGEQVASKDGRIWLAGIRADLEAMGYVFGASDLCAAGVCAPHIRQSLYWMAYSDRSGSFSRERASTGNGHRNSIVTNGSSIRVGDTYGSKKERFGCVGIQMESEQKTRGCSFADNWSKYSIVQCADGKSRRLESGSFPLASRIPERVVRLRGYGNAIVPQLAAEFIQASLEAIEEI